MPEAGTKVEAGTEVLVEFENAATATLPGDEGRGLDPRNRAACAHEGERDMRLSELAKPTEHKLLGQDVEVGELQYNSRKVKAGDVFCCIVGTFADGHAYAAQAVEQGAAALVVERELPWRYPKFWCPIPASPWRRWRRDTMAIPPRI